MQLEKMHAGKGKSDFDLIKWKRIKCCRNFTLLDGYSKDFTIIDTSSSILKKARKRKKIDRSL